MTEGKDKELTREEKDKLQLDLLEKNWLEFVGHFRAAREAWGSYRNKVQVLNLAGIRMDYADPEFQKMLVQPWAKSPFEKGIPVMIQAYRRQGGIDYLYFKEEEKEAKDNANSSK